MQSVLDRLGGFSQQSSVYNVLGRAFSLILPGEPRAHFCPLFTEWADRIHCCGVDCLPL